MKLYIPICCFIIGIIIGIILGIFIEFYWLKTSELKDSPLNIIEKL